MRLLGKDLTIHFGEDPSLHVSFRQRRALIRLLYSLWGLV